MSFVRQIPQLPSMTRRGVLMAQGSYILKSIQPAVSKDVISRTIVFGTSICDTQYLNNSTLSKCSRKKNNYKSDAARRFSSSADVRENFPRLSVAVVGAGPSGFYATKYLTSSVLKRIKNVPTSGDNLPEATASKFGWSGIDVDIIERLPTPYGLVRYGVAPDHPEVKNVENDFAALFENQNDASSVSYYGNVSVGKDISLSKLQSLYDVVILAYGCQAACKRLGIPGEDSLEGVLRAREFVAWYNGHPEYGHIGSIVQKCLWNTSGDDERELDSSAISPARVVVIGQGNVALDCARILAKGKPGLIDTDTPSQVLDILKGGVSHVSVVGRRGHIQGAFTIKELRELTKLKDEGNNATFIVRREELERGMTDSSKEELKGAAGRPKTRIDKLLQDSSKLYHSSDEDSKKQVELRFLMSPVSLVPKDSNSDRVGNVICERTKLEGEAFNQKAVGTGETESFPADLVLVSIGYKGMPLEGMEESQMFDQSKGVVVNEHGKVFGADNLFVTGWIKRGPTGIIGTNIMDSKDTANSIMSFLDLKNNNAQPQSSSSEDESESLFGRNGLEEFLKSNNVEFVNWEQYLRIESSEKEPSRLRSGDHPREKFLSVEDMLIAAKG